MHSSELTRSVTRCTEAAAFYLLLIVVALCPLPFGSNGPESMAVLSALSGIPLVLASLAVLLTPTEYSFGRVRGLIVAAICFGLFGVWGVVQIVPGLPQPLPHPLWSQAAAILGIKEFKGTISIDPELTRLALVKTAGYFAIAISSILLLREEKRRRVACVVIVAAGAFYAAYGLFILFTGDCCVAWQRKTTYLGTVTGPFINRNNFATYLGIVLLVALAHVMREFAEMRHVNVERAGRPFWTKLELLLTRRGLMLAAVPVLAIALLLTQSRAGVASSILGAGVLVILLSFGRVLSSRGRLRHVVVYAAGLLVVLGAFGGPLFEHFRREGIEDVYRTQSYEIIETGIRTSPWVGHGFGTFPEAFPLYRDDRLISRRFFDKAQNTYLELALDMGLPATVILMFGFGGVAAQLLIGMSRHRVSRRIFPATGLGAMALVGAHSLLDFSMQIPAVATTLAIIVGIAITESGIWRSKTQPSASPT